MASITRPPMVMGTTPKASSAREPLNTARQELTPTVAMRLPKEAKTSAPKNPSGYINQLALFPHPRGDQAAKSQPASLRMHRLGGLSGTGNGFDGWGVTLA